jgi:transporter family-2 protein
VNSTAILVGIALVGGMAVTLQGQFMGQMDRNIGTAESVFITYGIGAVLAGLMMLMLKGGTLSTAFTAVPAYTFISGLLGLIIVSSIGYTVPRLGVTTALTLVLVGQYFLATLMDNNGWFGTPIREIGFKQISGLLVILAGTYLVTSETGV